jgi:4-amino-4-deoxy-L-arabinose transferase-like glycosyltransferase
MRILKVNIILFLILLVGFALRIYRISSVPPSLGNDEISIAYDAYSVINIGKDSNDAFLPLSFKSHGEYKAPLYIYVAGPFVKILGNNEIAVRLPSVIFGTLTILGIYLLVKKLRLGENTALFSAFLLAITPWHVYTSRIALESNLALFFLVFGALYFLKGIEKGKYLFLSSILLALSLYAYHTEWVFVPLIMIFSSFLYWKNIVNKKRLVYWWLIFLALIPPLLINAFFGQGGVRAGNEFILKDFVLQNQLSGVLNIFSRLFIIFSFWLEKYLSYTNLGYIFTNGLDVSAGYGISDFGLLNILQLPLVLLGILYIAKHIREKSTLYILFWILVAPLISSLTEGEPNLVRNLISVIPLTVLSSWGLVWIWERWGSKRLMGLAITILIFNFAFFYRYYITQFPYHFAERWTYGFKQIAQYIGQNKGKYNQIYIDPRFGVVNNSFVGVPSLYVLYFNREDPQAFLNTKYKNIDQFSFLKYTVKNIDWTTEEIDKGSLYIVSSHSIPLKRQNMKEIYTIKLPDGTIAFRFFQSY